MTKKEALVAVLQISVPDLTLEKTMIDNAITGADAYSVADEKGIDLCAVVILQGLMSVPNITEGGMSVTYDRNGLHSRLLSLAKKHDLTDILNQYKPTVTGKSVW